MSNSKSGFKPLPPTSTSPGQDVGGSGNGECNRIPGNWSTPGSPSSMEGEFNPNPANWSTPGTRVFGGETYCDGDNANGPTSHNGGSGAINPLPASSTNPGQRPDGGDYHDVSFNVKESFGSQPAPVDTTAGMRETGYKVLGKTNPTEDRLISNCDPSHQGNWSYEQQSYFTTPDYDGDGYE